MAIATIGALLGRDSARGKISEGGAFLGLLALTFMYAMWIYYRNSVSFADGLLTPAVAAYLSNVMLFLLVGTCVAGGTNALNKKGS